MYTFNYPCTQIFFPNIFLFMSYDYLAYLSAARGSGPARAADEVLQECGRQRPDVLLIFGANQQDAPSVRSIIDTVKTVGAHPNMKIVVGGGVFSRTQELTGVSLGEQIGAHAEINNPEDLVEGLETFYGEEAAVKVA